jgi:thiol-disulfide isomerase/thioredoxin
MSYQATICYFCKDTDYTQACPTKLSHQIFKPTVHLKKIIITSIYLLTSIVLNAQEATGIQAEIRKMSKEADPGQCVYMRNQFIQGYKLDSLKDSETIDLLNGTVAIAYAKRKQYQEFEKFIGFIKNKFNQTSMLSQAANELLDNNIDADYACKIAKETLDKYFSFKDDPAARPEGYTKEDWERFMSFAKFPYYDTYAKSLFALKRYDEAIKYQLMALDDKPEEGLPESVERYAKLLELTGKKEEAKQLLLKRASLQNNDQTSWIQEIKPKMLNETAPAFSLKDIEGKQVSLSDYKGKIVILDLWATWCVPCIASFPAMQKQMEKHPDVIFLFIAVNEKADGVQERVKTFINKYKYPFLVLIDEPIKEAPGKFVITSSYKPTGIPAKYFIDRNGKLRFKSKGFNTDSELINEMDAVITILKSL